MRGDNGLFTLKGTEPRKLRSIMLTQFCWEKLQELAAKDNCSRSDLLERWAASGSISEMENQVAALQAEKQELLSRITDAQTKGIRFADELATEKDAMMERLRSRQRELEDVVKFLSMRCESLESELATVRQERDSFDQELTELHTKNGDLNLELALLKEEKSQTPAQTGDEQLRERLAEIIAKAENADTGYTTKAFSRGLKDLKALL